ncbi:MAG: nucleotidyltransferase family protein [Acidimicrobiia bacterium]
MEGPITGVVLAAGAAVRMGEPKLLLPLGGSTVLNTTLASVEASEVDRVIVVTGANASLIESSIVAERASVVRNPDFRRGNMSSFLTATATDPDASAYIVVPGDLPTVRTSVIDQMVRLWREGRPWAAVTSYTDGVAHPFLVSRDALDFAVRTRGDRVLGHLLIDSDDDRVLRLDAPVAAPLDVNTPDEYDALLDAEGRTGFEDE